MQDAGCRMQDKNLNIPEDSGVAIILGWFFSG